MDRLTPEPEPLFDGFWGPQTHSTIAQKCHFDYQMDEYEIAKVLERTMARIRRRQDRSLQRLCAEKGQALGENVQAVVTLGSEYLEMIGKEQENGIRRAYEMVKAYGEGWMPRPVGVEERRVKDARHWGFMREVEEAVEALGREREREKMIRTMMMKYLRRRKERKIKRRERKAKALKKEKRYQDRLGPEGRRRDRRMKAKAEEEMERWMNVSTRKGLSLKDEVWNFLGDRERSGERQRVRRIDYEREVVKEARVRHKEGAVISERDRERVEKVKAQRKKSRELAEEQARLYEHLRLGQKTEGWRLVLNSLVERGKVFKYTEDIWGDQARKYLPEFLILAF